MKQHVIGTGVLLVLFFFLSVPSAQAQTPELVNLSLTPGVAVAGSTIQFSAEVTNITGMEIFSVVTVDGNFTNFQLSNVVINGQIVTGEIPIPANTLNGQYQLRELGFIGLDGAVYRFIDASSNPGISACPSFQNIGVFGCASALVGLQGGFEVIGGITPPPPPELLGISFTPPIVQPGNTITVTVDVTNAEAIAGLSLIRPAGTNGGLPMGIFQKNGTTFTGTINVPANAATGTWHLRELGIRNAAGESYRWIDSTFDPTLSPCPSFQNLGVFICSSTLITNQGSFDVGGANTPLPDPELLSIDFNPSVVSEGGSTQLTVRVTNSTDVLFFSLVRPDGTSDFLPNDGFVRSGDSYTTTILVPTGTANGTWRIRELGARNAIDEEYRFIDVAAAPGLSPCPSFANIGVFGCASTLVRDQGAFDIGAPANQPPVANAGPDTTVECSGPNGTLVTLNGAASTDPDGDMLTFSWDGPFGQLGGTSADAIVSVMLPLGVHTITLTVADPLGQTATDEVVVAVQDTTAPSIDARLVAVQTDDPQSDDRSGTGDGEEHDSDDERRYRVVAQATDSCDPAPTVTADLNGQPVLDGQIVEIKLKGKKTKFKMHKGILKLETPKATLTVHAVDASGNTASQQVTLRKSQDDDRS